MCLPIVFCGRTGLEAQKFLVNILNRILERRTFDFFGLNSRSLGGSPRIVSYLEYFRPSDDTVEGILRYFSDSV